MTNERLQVNMRLERDLIDELDAVAGAESLDRAELARRLLRDGLRRERIDLAIRRYRAGDVSLGRAAEMARVSLYEMIDRGHDEGIPYELDAVELDRIGRASGHHRRPAMARETAVPYHATPADSTSGIGDQRDRFRPDHVRWLFVGESSPAGGTHFYRADSNLFRATQAAFVQAFGADVPTGPADRATRTGYGRDGTGARRRPSRDSCPPAFDYGVLSAVAVRPASVLLSAPRAMPAVTGSRWPGPGSAGSRAGGRRLRTSAASRSTAAGTSV